jgi:hypothetical protein
VGFADTGWAADRRRIRRERVARHGANAEWSRCRVHPWREDPAQAARPVIRPHIAGLSRPGDIPTQSGKVSVSWRKGDQLTFRSCHTVQRRAGVYYPAAAAEPVAVNGRPNKPNRRGYLSFTNVVQKTGSFAVLTGVLKLLCIG